MNISNKILSDITVHMKYAKYILEFNRRETWTELVDRNNAMHIKSYPKLKDEIENVFALTQGMSLQNEMAPVGLWTSKVVVLGL